MWLNDSFVDNYQSILINNSRNFLIMLRPELTLFVIFSTWAVQDEVSSIIRPRDLATLTFFISLLPIQIESSSSKSSVTACDHEFSFIIVQS